MKCEHPASLLLDQLSDREGLLVEDLRGNLQLLRRVLHVLGLLELEIMV